VNLDFTGAGSAKFARVTGELAPQTSPANQIALIVDGYVLSAPVVAQAITGGEVRISGSFTADSARHLAALVTSGALPVRLSLQDVTREP
jgi:preprotein translocase subunit SecD